MTIKMLNEIKEIAIIAKAQTEPCKVYQTTGAEAIELWDIILELIDDNIKLQLEKPKTKIMYRSRR
jgi:hypothetical protein